MRVYIAGMYTNGTADRAGRLYTELMNDRERGIVDAVTNQLESYHYIKADQYIERIRRDRARVFLDSGAFSAFTLGKEIDLKAYCEYMKRNADIIDVASVLDGIGDPLKTYQNQCLMEFAGERPLPCFHYGEDERYLEHYIQNYEYITLGGMVPNTTEQNKLWLDRIWSKYLCNEQGKPKCKVHGFGMTSVPLMLRYPWYSVDSSSWVQIGFRGGIMLPKFGVIAVSDTSPNRKVEGQHLKTMSFPAQHRIAEEVERRGFTLDRLASAYISRWVYNLNFFVEMQEDMKDKELTFQLDQMSIF